MSEAGPVLYDPVELRGRIVVCFSVAELRALADSLGVGGITWERGIHEAAREVVRQSERYAGLPALVAKLREMRPLVEWPEPAGTAAPPSAPIDAAPSSAPAAPPPAAMPSPAAMPPPSPATLGLPTPPALSASPGRLGPPPPPTAAPVPPAEPGLSGPTLFDPYAPPPGPPVIQVPVSGPPAVSAQSHFGAWPGVAAEPEAHARGIDPRILLGVAGLMVVAAVIAYLAGRASTASTAPDAAPATSAPAARPVRGDGPAALAAEAIARSLANLARVCELPSSTGTNALVFKRVFERCGPGVPSRRPYTPPAPTATPDGSTDPAASDDPAPARAKRPGRGGDPAPAQATPSAKGCMGGCDAQHGTCKSRCGPEPTEGSAYDGYQHCMGRCLTEASRCRMGCR